MFSTRMRADSIFPDSRSWAMARRCCLDTASSFCWTIRRRAIESLSCTLSFAWGELEGLSQKRDGVLLTMMVDEGAMVDLIDSGARCWKCSSMVVLAVVRSIRCRYLEPFEVLKLVVAMRWRGLR